METVLLFSAFVAPEPMQFRAFEPSSSGVVIVRSTTSIRPMETPRPFVSGRTSIPTINVTSAAVINTTSADGQARDNIIMYAPIPNVGMYGSINGCASGNCAAPTYTRPTIRLWRR